MEESSKDRLRRILGGGSSNTAVKRVTPRERPDQNELKLNDALRPATPNTSNLFTGPPGLTINPLPPIAPAQPIEQPAIPKFDPRITQPVQAPAAPSSSDVRAHLQELRSKMAQLSNEFATGEINRMQFEAIYKHYQEKLQQVENQMYALPGSDAWQGAITQGMTGRLRERHRADVLSYAIYDNESSMPLATVGTFNIDTSLLVPMLSSFRSATTEIFGAGLRSTEIEGGRWLCFMPGHFTTLIALFSIEPAKLQLSLIEDLHRDFETANVPAFEQGQADEAAQSFTRIWALDSFSAPSTEME
ncbi:MAG TPA: hypothetical protein VFF70_07320 [Anaerolineae bacterium]|nr:hypothetical protein [Anaerolineae bacterium]